MTAECANISRRCKLSSFRICQCPQCRMLWWLYFEQQAQSGSRCRLCYRLHNGNQAPDQCRDCRINAHPPDEMAVFLLLFCNPADTCQQQHKTTASTKSSNTITNKALTQPSNQPEFCLFKNKKLRTMPSIVERITITEISNPVYAATPDRILNSTLKNRTATYRYRTIV